MDPIDRVFGRDRLQMEIFEQKVEHLLEEARDTLHHGSEPAGLLLSANAVLDDAEEKWVFGSGTKGVVAEFPVEVVLGAKVAAERQFFEGEDALEIQERREIFPEENVEIEIEPAIVINRKVAEKIDALNVPGKGVEGRLVFRVFISDE